MDDLKPPTPIRLKSAQAPDLKPLEQVTQLAGVFVAQALATLAAGEAMFPLLASETAGVRKLIRYSAPNVNKSLRQGADRLVNNPDKVDVAVFVVEGSILLDDRKHNALIGRCFWYSQDAKPVRLELVLPYVSGANAGVKALPMEFLGVDGVDPKSLSIAALQRAFTRGAQEHPAYSALFIHSVDDDFQQDT